MADNIGTVYIPAPVIQLKDTQFLEDGAIVPQVLEVPCRSVHIDIGQYWAIPTKDNGIFSGWWYQPAATSTGVPVAAPTFDSFSVLRIRDKLSDYTWWILATVTSYTRACNTCCGSAFTPITYSVPIIAPCEIVCDAIDGDGNYFLTFAAPDLPAGYEYVINGSQDGFALPELTASSLDDILTQLNANYDEVGDFSPQVIIQWTRSGNTIIGTLQDGLGAGLTFCMVIGIQEV